MRRPRRVRQRLQFRCALMDVCVASDQRRLHLAGMNHPFDDAVPPQRIAQLRGDDSIHLAVTPSNDYWYLALNEARPPWQDVRVRQAVAYAIDRASIVQATSYGAAQAAR